MFVCMHVCEREIKSRGRIIEDLGPPDMSLLQPTLSVFLKSYHVVSTTVSPGIAPCPVPDHNTMLSWAGSLSSTQRLFRVSSCFLPLVSFSELCFLKSNHRFSCRVIPTANTHYVILPLTLPHLHQQKARVLGMQPFLRSRYLGAV